jgi:hypothetical protein
MAANRSRSAGRAFVYRRLIQRASLEHPELPPASLFADGSSSSRTSQTGDGGTLVFERANGLRVEIWERQLRDGATACCRS